MTTYKCNNCGEYWQQGPTRDIKYDKPCAKCLTNTLETIRKDPKLWKSGGKGGADMYLGLPPAMREIDEILNPYIKYKTEE
jgi:hypothetical protein